MAHFNELEFKFIRWLNSFVVDPSSDFYYGWLLVISSAALYNLVVVIARAVFPLMQINHRSIWMLFDYVFDFTYLLDMFIESRKSECDLIFHLSY